MKRLATLTGTALTAALIVSCSSSGGSPASTAGAGSSAPASSSPASSAPASASSGITIDHFAYSGTMTVKVGQKVTVTNKDSTAHTLTDKVTKLFDTGNIPGNGGTGTFVAPKKAGTYKFGCTYHPNMAGTLIVTS